MARKLSEKTRSLDLRNETVALPNLVRRVWIAPFHRSNGFVVGAGVNPFPPDDVVHAVKAIDAIVPALSHNEAPTTQRELSIGLSGTARLIPGAAIHLPTPCFAAKP